MQALQSKSQRIYIKFLAPRNILCIVSPQKSLLIFDLILLESNLAKFCNLRINITLPLKSAFLTWDTHFSPFQYTYTSYAHRKGKLSVSSWVRLYIWSSVDRIEQLFLYFLCFPLFYFLFRGSFIYFDFKSPPTPHFNRMHVYFMIIIF